MCCLLVVFFCVWENMKTAHFKYSQCSSSCGFGWLCHFSWGREAFSSHGRACHRAWDGGAWSDGLLPNKTQVVLGAARTFVRNVWIQQCGGSWCSERRRCWGSVLLRSVVCSGFIHLGCRQASVVVQAAENRLGMSASKNLILWPQTSTFPPLVPIWTTGYFPSAKITALELGLREGLHLPP